MSKVKNSFLDLVGNTPLVRVNNLIKKDELKADVLAKLEYFNPAGSVKDRIAKEMIQDALEKGLINENTTLIEPTSGNTGIGLSAVATALNLKIIITMPETMSVERRNLMKAYGAELVLTPETLDTKIYDEIITVENEDAFATGKEMAKTEGILVGISSGAALYAAKELAKREENAGKTIVVLLPDGGDRYLSTPLIQD